MTSVGARWRGQHGAPGARQSNERAQTVWSAALEEGTTRSQLSARSSSSCVLAEPARRWTESSNEAERGGVGRRSALRPTRRTWRTTTRSARAGGVRPRNDALAAQRSLAVVVSARGAGAVMDREQ
jgi:hypothetical protein